MVVTARMHVVFRCFFTPPYGDGTANFYVVIQETLVLSEELIIEGHKNIRLES